MQKTTISRVFLIILLTFSIFTFASAEPVKATISTNKGDIVLELYADKAPASVKNFLQYASDEFYNNTIFHRIIDGFMIQGGGYTTDYEKKKTRDAIQNEANNGLKNNKYTIAMARTSAPHSATSQFYINTADNTPLNHRSMEMRHWGYAVFGRVIDGHDVVDSISQTPTGAGGPFPRDVPSEAVIINSISVLSTETAD